MKSLLKLSLISLFALASMSAWSVEITADEVRGQNGSGTMTYLGNVEIVFPDTSGLEVSANTVKNLPSGERVMEGDVTLKYEGLTAKSDKVKISPVDGGLLAKMDKAEVTSQ